jgi:MFS family permease
MLGHGRFRGRVAARAQQVRLAYLDHRRARRLPVRVRHRCHLRSVLYIAPDLHAGTLGRQWIVGSLLLGAVVGAVASGYTADRFSRKWTKFGSGCIYVVAALASAFALNLGWLIGARFVLGLAVGTASFVAPMYISERTPPRIRGGTVSFNQLMVTSGILVAYLINYAFSGVADNWRWMLGLGALPGLALAIGMLFVPHTPRWLMQRGREDEARACAR